MSYSYAEKKRIRKEFGVLPHILDVPYLLSIQTESYKKFLQLEVAKEARKCSGLEAALELTFPIESKNGQYELHYVDYQLGEPMFTEGECQVRGSTFDAPLNVKLRLVSYNKEALPEEKIIEDVKEEFVFMGDLPLMTNRGSFIINGTERVVVSQLHRSPGVFFSHDSVEENVYYARIIPYRGSWLDFEFDSKGLLWSRIDRKKKIHATIILKALDYSIEDIVKMFYKSDIVEIINEETVSLPLDKINLKGKTLAFNVLDNDGNIVIKKDKKVNARDVKKIKDAGIFNLIMKLENLPEIRLYNDILNTNTGELVASANDTLTHDILSDLIANKITQIDVIDFLSRQVGLYISDTLKNDITKNSDEALVEIYKVMRPGDPPAQASAKALFEGMFFLDNRYSLSDIGRMKLNLRLKTNTFKDVYTLQKEDVVGVVSELINIREGHGKVDDIDHLGNRRVRSVGEMVENQFRVGLFRVERGIRESMSLSTKENLMPKDIVNSKPITASIKDFFCSGALSQFMDQDNPLSEVTHKRRISALGPGGLSRDRAGFEVRDVHTTHYGRLCPIETPEGPNIGLINSLSCYARVNSYGFLEAPYRKVLDGVVTNDIVYLSAIDEDNCIIAQASATLDKNRKLADDLIQCRAGNETIFAEANQVDYMDVSAKQMVSVAAALIPFLEHDDANRVLMGANMQRQAVPTVRAEKPFVGTGIEKILARDSGICRVAKNSGIIDAVDSDRIVMRVDVGVNDLQSNMVDIYNLIKFKRSNKNTCINQKPIVNVGDRIEKGDILADGFSTDFGELSLGHNLMVAFMPWNGYNFEDSILLSEKVTKDEKYTSIHIDEYTCIARDTKLGSEEITADIPNVSESNLNKLDESGIVYIGANVDPGDILVAKVTPKVEQQ